MIQFTAIVIISIRVYLKLNKETKLIKDVELEGILLYYCCKKCAIIIFMIIPCILINKCYILTVNLY
jgi:hypothetical protein